MFDENTLLHSQQVLEENEDLIAAIVENMQLGKLNDCISIYSLLQKNLVSMASALDNYPAEEVDPYEAIALFPDEIMRKDILDELRPAVSIQIPKSPLPHPCQKCAMQQISREKCRGELEHVEPNHKFSDTERIEFLHVTQVLEVRHRQRRNSEMLIGSANAAKRAYRKWTPHERYTVQVAMTIFGERNYRAISSVLCDRSAEQIRSFIFKTFSPAERDFTKSGKIPKAPPGYDPPRGLLCNPVFLKSHPEFVSLATERTLAPSQLAPRQGSNDWLSLLGIASGTATGYGPTGMNPEYPQFLPTSHPSEGTACHPTDGVSASALKTVHKKMFPKKTIFTLNSSISEINEMNPNSNNSSNEGPLATGNCDHHQYSLQNQHQQPFIWSQIQVNNGGVDQLNPQLVLPSCPRQLMFPALTPPYSASLASHQRGNVVASPPQQSLDLPVSRVQGKGRRNGKTTSKDRRNEENPERNGEANKLPRRKNTSKSSRNSTHQDTDALSNRGTRTTEVLDCMGNITNTTLNTVEEEPQANEYITSESSLFAIHYDFSLM